MFLVILINTSCLRCPSWCRLRSRQIRRPVCCAWFVLVIQGVAFVLIISFLEVFLELLDLDFVRQLIKVIRQFVEEVLIQPLKLLFPYINHCMSLLESWNYLLLGNLLKSFAIKCHQALGLDFSIVFISSMCSVRTLIHRCSKAPIYLLHCRCLLEFCCCSSSFLLLPILLLDILIQARYGLIAIKRLLYLVLRSTLGIDEAPKANLRAEAFELVGALDVDRIV